MGVTPFPEHFDPPFHRALGIQMGMSEDGEGVAWITVDPERHYGNAWVHGGLVAALVDISSGITIARSVKGDPMNTIEGTIELKVNYLQKVVDGDIKATAHLLHIGKRIAVTEVDIKNGDRLVAKGLATFILRDQE
ncbi:MAG TPA: PaaI family thioesterase [Actinomycetota bacterium]|nr:PaaI family thioesterase [Actinomycetota bacterium]